MELYFKPNAAGGGSRILITDGMSDQMKEAQRAVAKAAGMLPVEGYEARPAPCLFGAYAEKILPVTDRKGEVVSYAHSWVFTPFRLRLSQEKLIADPVVAPSLPKLVEECACDPGLAAWWTGTPTYTRGSAIAERVIGALGLDEARFESAVLRCRG